mmetsp:Transcript_33475/g.6071  ORF Transcript_33475/g.6071 Transcript_33475/m.6071 type:complete len:83 (+) Transcript_33475:1016-1264(+)
MRHSGEGNSFAYAMKLLMDAGYRVDLANNQPFLGGSSYITSISYECGPCGTSCSCEKCIEIINELNAREDVFKASFACRHAK